MGPFGALNYNLRMADITTGTLIDDKYAILCRVGEGGMSVVYEARHEEMNRTVALKVLNAAVDHEPETIARFRTEGTGYGARYGSVLCTG